MSGQLDTLLTFLCTLGYIIILNGKWLSCIYNVLSDSCTNQRIDKIVQDQRLYNFVAPRPKKNFFLHKLVRSFLQVLALMELWHDSLLPTLEQI